LSARKKGGKCRKDIRQKKTADCRETGKRKRRRCVTKMQQATMGQGKIIQKKDGRGQLAKQYKIGKASGCGGPEIWGMTTWTCIQPDTKVDCKAK